MVAIMRALRGESIRVDEVQKQLRRDWVHETNGGNRIDFQTFFGIIFDLVNTWCSKVESRFYTVFLRHLFQVGKSSLQYLLL